MSVPVYEAKADLFKKLSHPARIRVLELLCEREHAVHELLAQIDIEPSNLSQQLGVLRASGLVQSRRVRSEVRYSLALTEISDLLLAGRRILASLLEAQNRELSHLHGELSVEASATRGGS